MRTVTLEELKQVGAFDLDRYPRYLLGIDMYIFTTNTTSVIRYRPHLCECLWFETDSSIGYGNGTGDMLECVSNENGDKVTAYDILQEISPYEEDSAVICWIGEHGGVDAEAYLLTWD